MQDTPDDPEHEFAARLKLERQDLGLSQADLAERARNFGLDVHSTAITRIEAHKRGISLNEFFSLSLAVGQMPEDMIRQLRQQVEIGAGFAAELKRQSEEPRSPAEEAKTIAFMSSMVTELLARLERRLETGRDDLEVDVEAAIDRIQNSLE